MAALCRLNSPWPVQRLRITYNSAFSLLSMVSLVLCWLNMGDEQAGKKHMKSKRFVTSRLFQICVVLKFRKRGGLMYKYALCVETGQCLRKNSLLACFTQPKFLGLLFQASSSNYKPSPNLPFISRDICSCKPEDSIFTVSIGLFSFLKSFYIFQQAS
jgi:hypothetical protein